MIWTASVAASGVIHLPAFAEPKKRCVGVLRKLLLSCGIGPPFPDQDIDGPRWRKLPRTFKRIRREGQNVAVSQPVLLGFGRVGMQKLRLRRDRQDVCFQRP